MSLRGELSIATDRDTLSEPTKHGHGSLRHGCSSTPATRSRSRGELSEREKKLVAEYSKIVKRLAAKLAFRLPSHVQLGDLECAGMSGLWDALLALRSREIEHFDNYARLRIKGAMKDELRREDWATRHARRIERGDGVNRMKILLFESPADYAHLSIAKRDTELELDEKRLLDRALDALEHLPPRTAKVLREYFLEERTSLELAKELGVSEPRISQLLKHGVSIVRDVLNGKLPEPKVKKAKKAPEPKKKRRNARFEFARLKVGEAFTVKTQNLNSLASNASSFGKRHGVKLSVRKVQKGVYSVVRIA